MSNVEKWLKTYESTKVTSNNNENKISNEERLKKYFNTIIPKGKKNDTKRVRILPLQSGDLFEKVFFHEIQVDGQWRKLYDPAQEKKPSPLNEVYEGLRMTGSPADIELSKQYRSREFYIMRVIDRDNEEDGVKFWRFKKNIKNEGILDKIMPIIELMGDITDPTSGNDLILTLSLSKSNNGKEYTSIQTIIPDRPSPLSHNKEMADSWLNDTMVWSDVYSKPSEEYLRIVASGDVPKWDNNLNKFVSSSEYEESINSSFNKVNEELPDEQINTYNSSQTTNSSPLVDNNFDDDLPF